MGLRALLCCSWELGLGGWSFAFKLFISNILFLWAGAGGGGSGGGALPLNASYLVSFSCPWLVFIFVIV